MSPAPMDDHYLFLQNLALVLGTAAFTIVLFHKLRQPVVLGYLLAGMIIGPHVPIPLDVDENIVRTLAELGIILVMFSIGLEFNIKRLVKLAPTAGFIALLECSLMLWLGYMAGQLLGWTTRESIYAGAIIAISSTTIIAKVFQDRPSSSKLTDIVFGILIVEDLIAILLLTALTTLSGDKGLSASNLIETTGALTVFLAALFFIGLWVIPRAIRSIVRFKQREITLIVSVGLCFGLALLAHAFGYSVALGAFIAGALIAESGESKTIEVLIQPLRDIFAAIFFVAVGLMIDPGLIFKYWPAVLLFTTLVLCGKVIGISLGTFLTGRNIRTSVQSGMALAQIGEFSFIIAGIGLSTGSTREFLYPVAVGVSAITTLTTPWLIRYSDHLAKSIERNLPNSFQTFASLYGSWIRQLSLSRSTGEKARIRRLIILLVTDLLLLTGVIISASLLFDRAVGFLSSFASIPPFLGTIIGVSSAVILAAPFCIGIIRCARSLGLKLALQAMPIVDKQSLDRAAAPRRALVVTLQFAIILVAGLILMAFVQPFLPLLYSVLTFLLSLLILGIILWINAEKLEGHVKAGAQMVMETLMPNKLHPTDNTPEQIRNLLPGLGHITSIKLEPGSSAIGKTLTELNLRGLTGVTVIAIGRDHDGIAVPSGQETLKIHDTLALTGTPESIETAKLLLL